MFNSGWEQPNNSGLGGHQERNYDRVARIIARALAVHWTAAVCTLRQHPHGIKLLLRCSNLQAGKISVLPPCPHPLWKMRTEFEQLGDVGGRKAVVLLVLAVVMAAVEDAGPASSAVILPGCVDLVDRELLVVES